MRRSRRSRLSDEQADRLLAGDDAPVEAAAPLSALTSQLREAGRTPPSDAVAERHLAAIVAEVRDTRHGDAAPAARPARRARGVSRGLLVPRRLMATAAAFTAVVVLAIAGALPGPVQAAAADLLAVVGIGVPDGRSTSQPGDDAPAPRIERRERSLPRSSRAPSVTGAPRQGTQGDRRDRQRGTGSAGTDAGDRRPSDRPAISPADRRGDDRREDRVDGSDDDSHRDDRVDGSDNDAHRDDDETKAIRSDDDERPSGPQTDADTDSGEGADDPAGAGPIDDGDTHDSLEEDRAETAEPRSADETTLEGD